MEIQSGSGTTRLNRAECQSGESHFLEPVMVRGGETKTHVGQAATYPWLWSKGRDG